MDMNDVSVIIYLLKKIDEDETIDLNEKHVLIDTVVYLADDCLTGDDNFKNIITVRESGYDVFAQEQDLFGWLIGCIQLKRGVIFG